MSEASAANAIRNLAAVHRTMLGQRDLQFKFTVAPPPQPPPHWLMVWLKALAPLLPYVFWGAVAAGALIILVFVVREVTHRKTPVQAWRPSVMGGEEGGWRPAPHEARALLQEADGLAAQGRYEEAAHLILLRSIEDMQARKPSAIRPSLTSRDIAGLGALSPAARVLFAGIAQRVERSLFGGGRVDREAFLTCRTAYEQFAAGVVWS